MSRNQKDLRGVLSGMGIGFEVVQTLVHAIVRRGGTIEHLRRIQKEPKLLAQIIDLLVPADSSACAFPVWRTVTLGLRKTPGHYAEVLEQKGFKIGDWARQILGKIFCAQEEIEERLVKVTARDLGFTKNPTRAEIYEKAVSFRLVPCVAEVGPALREQYEDQPSGEWILVAMEPIAVSGGDLSVFRVDRVSVDRWLLADCGAPGLRWALGCSWVFSLRK